MAEPGSRYEPRMSFDASSIDPSILQYIHQIDSEDPRPRNAHPPPRPPRLKRVIKKLNEPVHHDKTPSKPILKYSHSIPFSPGLNPPGGSAAQQQKFLDSIYEAHETDSPYESFENTRRDGMDLDRGQLNVNASKLTIPEPLDNEFWAPGHWKNKTQDPTTFIHVGGLPQSSEGNGFRHADPSSASIPATSKPTDAGPPTSAFSNNTSEAPDILENMDGDAAQANRLDDQTTLRRSVPAPAFRSNHSGQPGWFPDFHPAYESNYTKRRPAPQVSEDIEQQEPLDYEPPARSTFPSRPSFTFRAPSHAPTLQRQHSVISPYTPHPWAPNPFEADFRPGQRSSAYFSPLISPVANPWEDEVSSAKRKAEDEQQRRKKRRVAFAMPKSFKSDHPKIIRKQTPYYEPTFSAKFRKLINTISRVFGKKTPEERQAEKERKLREKRDRMESEESEELRSGFSGHEWTDSGSVERASEDNEYVY